MVVADDVFDPFGLDEHEEEKATLSFDLFPSTEIAPPVAAVSRKNDNDAEDDDRRYRSFGSTGSRTSSIDGAPPVANNMLSSKSGQPQYQHHPPQQFRGGGGGGGLSSMPPPPTVQRVYRTASGNSSSHNYNMTTTTAAKALPPKITVKLVVREDATAKATSGGSSHVEIVGSVQAQIQCSDATKNAPFRLQVQVVPPGVADGGGGAAAATATAATTTPAALDMRTVNPEFVTEQPSSPPPPEEDVVETDDAGDNNNDETRRTRSIAAAAASSSSYLHVYIPKHEIGLVHLMDFAVQQHIQRMPLLLERKISVKDHGRTVRVSIQVRTKLANKGDLKDLSIAIAVPMEVDGESICVLRGDDGIYDELRRIVHWRLDELKRGESLMVAAEARLWERPGATAAATTGKDNNNNNKTPPLEFPVVLRASSNDDQISAVDCQAVSADGHPSSVTFSRSNSFRLLYRLQ